MYAIETKHLCKNYKDLKAVDNLSLTINEGELFSLLGVNGAGKTTTIKMLCCLIKPSSGDAFVEGNSIINDNFKVKEITNISPQETAVAPNLTVHENLEMIGLIYGIPKENINNEVESTIKEFELDEIKDKKAKTLSGGWQRRLSIAMALISKPKVLFLDEPTLGLDVIARRELWNTIEGLKGKITIILTSHYLEEVEALADRVGIMAKGKLLATGTTLELKEMAKTDKFEDAFIKIATGDIK